MKGWVCALQKLVPALALAGAIGYCSVVNALNLSSQPLFLSNQVTPNVMFLMDDSGSMDWSIMSRSHWNACAYDPAIYGGFSSSNCGNLQTNGLIKIKERSYSSYRDNKTYLYKNYDNIYGNCSGYYSWSM